MITTALVGVLLVARAMSSLSSSGSRTPTAVVDRMLGPAGVAFAALLLLRLVDLWISNA